VALAISSHLPLYGRVADRTVEIPQAEVRKGMFWGGATRFENLRGETIIGLAVSKIAFSERFRPVPRFPLALVLDGMQTPAAREAGVAFPDQRRAAGDLGLAGRELQ
jgi:hypothetical protein